MSIDLDLATYLKTKSGVTDIVGTRVYARRAPQTTSQTKTAARIVYRLLPGSVRHYHAGGVSTLVEAAIQLELADGTYPDCQTLYTAIYNEIDAFRGTWNGTSVRSCFLSPPFDMTQDPTQGDDQGYWAVGAVAEVMYVEAAPSR